MQTSNEIVKHRQDQLQTTFSYVMKRKEAVQLAPAGINSDETYFYYLQENYTIKEYEEKKLSDGKFHGPKLARYHIGCALTELYKMVGLKQENYPDKEFSKRIALYIQTAFHFITPGEIVKAVEFALQEKFSTQDKDGKYILEHYQVMDLKFLNRLLNLYVKFRYGVKQSLNAKLEEINKPVPTEQEIQNMFRRDDQAVKSMLREFFQQFKESPENQTDWFRADWFYWLVDIGLMQYDKEFLNKRYRAIQLEKKHLSDFQIKVAAMTDLFYHWMKSVKRKKDPFKIFETVSYLSPQTYELYRRKKA